MNSKHETDFDELYVGLASGKIRFSADALSAIMKHARRNLTHALADIRVRADQLDYESISDVEDEALETKNEGVRGCSTKSSLPFDSIASPGHNPKQLILRVKQSVGRATIFRQRSKSNSNFSISHDEDDKEACSQRTQDANDRKAFRKAADEAMAQNLTTWVTFTFDDQHRSDRPQEEFKRFKRRLRERYERRTGQSLKFVAVVALDDHGREHVHALLPSDASVQDIRESWQAGQIMDITQIEHEEIETKVRYMGLNLRNRRVTFGRFLRSRSQNEPDEDIPINGVYEGRDVLEEIIHPRTARVVQSKLFGNFTSVEFRFKPIREHGDM